MSKIFQRKALLLAAIVPAILVAGCATGNQQAMKGSASQASPTGEGTVEPGQTDMSPGMTETGTASPTATGVEGARTAVEGYFKALKAGNVDKVVDSFSDNAVVELGGEATAKGTQAIRTLYQGQLQGNNEMKQVTYTIEDTRAAGTEDAIVRATSKMGEESYRELFVLMKDGGQWKISELMNNQGS
ncbi:nuclear transport factor 2 family protein [Nonomuraea sp. B12E4]|uniref:YybH family protein n=1 Tax=Nonomuraea sp. B12E4 TaxID=3153564 RepID=UPI00325D075F